VDVSAEAGSAFPTGVVAPADFILMAERVDAIIHGHIAIAGEHFDLEFDVPKLLREGGEISALFVSHLTDIIQERKIDRIAFPDQSQIETVIPALTDALVMRGVSSPVIIRTRCVSGGEVIVPYQDRADLESGRRFLIIDDAINSGRTTVRVMSLVLNGSTPEHISSVALISRQGHDNVLATLGISRVRDVDMKFECWAHIPVRHYHPGDCPTCRRRDAAVLVAGAAPHGVGVSQYARMLARMLTAENYYETAQSVGGGAEQRLVYEVPIRVLRDAGGRLKVETRRFATIGGAKAALACAIGEQQTVDGEFVTTILTGITDVRLSCYILYQAASRTQDPVGLWGDTVFQKAFDAVTFTATPSSGQDEGIVEVCAAGIRDLTRALWFAPDGAFSRYLAVLLERGAPTIHDDTLYAEFMLLAYRFAASLSGHDYGEGQTHLLKLIENTLIVARKSEGKAHSDRSSQMDVVQRVMRLRRLQQIATGAPIIEPWLDGAVETLERLGYYSEHKTMGIPSQEAWVDADALRDKLSPYALSVANKDDPFVSDLFDKIDEPLRRLLSRPRQDAAHYAEAIGSALTPWLKAAEWSGHVKLDGFIRAEKFLHEAEADSKRLIVSLEKLDEAYRRRELGEIWRAVVEVADLLGKLVEVLYETAADDRPPLLRNLIQSQLYPLHQLAREFGRAIVGTHFSSGGHIVTTTGSFFDYSDEVINRVAPMWIVLLAPAHVVSNVVRDVLIGNIQKHWLHGRSGSRIRIHCDVIGAESIQLYPPHQPQTIRRVVMSVKLPHGNSTATTYPFHPPFGLLADAPAHGAAMCMALCRLFWLFQPANR
jgi:hypothetical protein